MNLRNASYAYRKDEDLFGAGQDRGRGGYCAGAFNPAFQAMATLRPMAATGFGGANS